MNYICRAADICDEMKTSFVALALIIESLPDLPQTDGIRYVVDKIDGYSRPIRGYFR